MDWFNVSYFGFGMGSWGNKMTALLIISLFLATFSAGALFGGLLLMAYYEREICNGDKYFTKQEREDLDKLAKSAGVKVEWKEVAKQQREGRRGK